MKDFANDIFIEELEDDNEFALILADTFKRGCESAGFVVEILPSVGGYSLSVFAANEDVCCDVFLQPKGYINTLN
ncbi:MAG: hypothetical protein ISP79_06555 [Methylophilaceae bacterium]|nr:hypothetical protein [Methylophilaceae bacterium]